MQASLLPGVYLTLQVLQVDPQVSPNLMRIPQSATIHPMALTERLVGFVSNRDKSTTLNDSVTPYQADALYRRMAPKYQPKDPSQVELTCMAYKPWVIIVTAFLRLPRRSLELC